MAILKNSQTLRKINNSMDIQSIFNVPEIVSPQSEKETSENIVESAKIIEASDNHSSIPDTKYLVHRI